MSLPDTSVQGWRSCGGDDVVHGSVSGVTREGGMPVSIEGSVVGRGLWRSVDGPGALVGGWSQAATASVNGGQRHVGVLVLNLQ